MRSPRISRHPWMRRVCSFIGSIGLLTMCLSGADAGQEVQDSRPKTKTIEISFTSHDGHPMFGKLTIPDTAGRHPIVVYVQTAEGMTIDMKRPTGRGGTFNYFDLYREKLPEMNVAFFSYEGRGVRMGDQPPRYEKIDWDVYNTSSLENKVRDVLSAVQVVRKQPSIDSSRIFLMGASEGTLLAAEAAAREPKQITGLILYGVMSSTMRDTFKFILTDGAFLTYRVYFDKDKDGRISQAEFEADPAKYREQVFKNAGFALFDSNSDGFWTPEDMRVRSNRYVEAVDTDNYEVLDRWAKTSAGVSTPNGWFKDHFAHKPIWTFLSQLDKPIGLFQGVVDPFTSAEGVRGMEQLAKKAGKSKMEFHYFEKGDHSLGIAGYFIRGSLPEGHKAIFEYMSRVVSSK